MLSEYHILDTIRKQLDDMFPAERKVAEYILDHPEKTAHLSITELADLSGSSDATIIRVCKRLGCKGFYQLKICLSSELGYIQLMGAKHSSDSMDIPEILRLIARNVITMEQNLEPVLLSSVADLLINSRHVYVIAAGNSIPCALDFSFRLSRIGIHATCSTIIENSLNSLSLGQPDEILVALSHSGSSRQVIQAMELAKNRGLRTVALTHSARNPVSLLAEYSISTAPESSLFYGYGLASHLYETVVIDILLYLITEKHNGHTEPDQAEMLLSESKI